MSEADIKRYNRQKADVGLKIYFLIGVVLAVIMCGIHYLSLYTGVAVSTWVVFFSFAGAGVLIKMWRNRPHLPKQNSRLKVPLPGSPVTVIPTQNESDVLAILPQNLVGAYDRRYIVFRNVGIGVLGLASLRCLLWGEWVGALFFSILPLSFVYYVLPRVRENLSKSKSIPLQTPDVGLILKPDGFICNRALVHSEWALEESQAIREWEWDEFSFLSVQPEVWSRYRRSHPPYYKFVLKTPYDPNPNPAGAIPGLKENYFDAICILRKPFYGREQEVLNYVRTHTDISVEMQDELH